MEVYGESKSVRIEYDTPYIKGLPITVTITETENERFKETKIRHTYLDPYTTELKAFHQAITAGGQLKTTPEDYKDDLVLFRWIIEALVKKHG